MSERDYEAEAAQEGWTPKDQWKGPEEKWVDAKTFVERGENILPIVKSKLDRVEQRLAAAESANKKFGEYHKKTIEKERKEHAARVAELEKKIAQAITDGDGDTYTRTNRELNSLKQDVIPNDANEYNALAQQWASENQWYIQNPKLGAYADGIAERIANEGYTGQAYFRELTKRVKADFPEEFENPQRKKPNGVEAGGDKGAVTKAKTYENLPADARKACDEFVKAGFMTKKDYVESYEWDEEGA